MAKIWLDWSDGRYSARQLTDEEAAEIEAKDLDESVAYIEDGTWQAYLRHCDRDATWQALWRAISNEQYMRRREKELMPLEDAQREIERLKGELERQQRMTTHFEDEWTRVRRAVWGHSRESREWTCVFPQPGCNVELLPPAWREQAKEILAKYRPELAAEGMKVQGCCCDHAHEHLHDATVIQLRAAGFLVEHDSEISEDECGEERHANDYDEYTCVFPQPGCKIDALPEEWRAQAQEILDNYRTDRMEGRLKYQGCCCSYGNHRLLDAAEAQKLRDAGFLVENDTSTA